MYSQKRKNEKDFMAWLVSFPATCGATKAPCKPHPFCETTLSCGVPERSVGASANSHWL